jgi:hypothetical protein
VAFPPLRQKHPFSQAQPARSNKWVVGAFPGLENRRGFGLVAGRAGSFYPELLPSPSASSTSSARRSSSEAGGFAARAELACCSGHARPTHEYGIRRSSGPRWRLQPRSADRSRWRGGNAAATTRARRARSGRPAAPRAMPAPLRARAVVAAGAMQEAPSRSWWPRRRRAQPQARPGSSRRESGRSRSPLLASACARSTRREGGRTRSFSTRH